MHLILIDCNSEVVVSWVAFYGCTHVSYRVKVRVRAVSTVLGFYICFASGAAGYLGGVNKSIREHCRVPALGNHHEGNMPDGILHLLVAFTGGSSMALTHVVVLKFKPGTDAAVKQQISTALGALPQKIPQIRLVPRKSW